MISTRNISFFFFFILACILIGYFGLCCNMNIMKCIQTVSCSISRLKEVLVKMCLFPVLHCSKASEWAECYENFSHSWSLIKGKLGRQHSFISIHLTLTCSHKKGLFDHFVSSITLREQCYPVTSRWTKYTHLLFCAPLTLTSCHPQGCLRMPFLVAATVFKQLVCNPLKMFHHLDDNLAH